MKPVTKYEARDGRVFDTEAAALEHEAILGMAAELVVALKAAKEALESCSHEDARDQYNHHRTNYSHDEDAVASALVDARAAVTKYDTLVRK